MTSNTKTCCLMPVLALGAALFLTVAGPAGADESFEEGYHCGDTFISIVDTDDFMRTVRKAHVVSIMAFAGQPLAAMFIHRKAEEDSFTIEFPAQYRKIIVACLN